MVAMEWVSVRMEVGRDGGNGERASRGLWAVGRGGRVLLYAVAAAGKLLLYGVPAPQYVSVSPSSGCCCAPPASFAPARSLSRPLKSPCSDLTGV